MKIFGIGLSRTGTCSLTKALNLIGFKCIHGPNDSITQKEFMSGNYNLNILNYYDSITDIPTSNFYHEFQSIYPDSKFILTTRDVDSWLTSMKIHYNLRPPNNDWRNFIRATTYGCLEFNEKRYRRVFELHHIDVLNKNNLLIINFKTDNNWNKLCNFLKCQIPNIKFPHLNKSILNKML